MRVAGNLHGVLRTHPVDLAQTEPDERRGRLLRGLHFSDDSIGLSGTHQAKRRSKQSKWLRYQYCV